MSEEAKRPEGCTEEHLEYLNDLRESGVTNMFGAGEYLQLAFGLDKRKAKEILIYWMKTFTRG